jgi:hypothetical protein
MEWRSLRVLRVCALSGLMLATAFPVFAQNPGFGIDPAPLINADRGPACQIMIRDNGTMVQNVGSTRLSSLINPGRPGLADVTTTTGSFYLSVDRPQGFSAAPQGGSSDVAFSTQFSGRGKTNFSLSPGTARVKLKNGLTNVEVHLEATKLSGSFPAGRYSATVTLRCE